MLGSFRTYERPFEKYFLMFSYVCQQRIHSIDFVSLEDEISLAENSSMLYHFQAIDLIHEDRLKVSFPHDHADHALLAFVQLNSV